MDSLMTEQECRDIQVAGHPISAPIEFVGAPDRMRGAVVLYNAGSERIAMRHGVLHSEHLHAAGLLSSPAYVSIPAILFPGATQSVSATLDLGHRIPPGRYEALIEVGAVKRNVILHVTEKVQLEISPKIVFISCVAGATVEKTVAVRNAGNTPCHIGDQWAVVLEDDLVVCRTLRAAINAAGDDSNDANAILSDMVHEAQAALSKEGVLRVRNRSGSVALAPGDLRVLTLEIQVPTEVDHHSRYQASIPLYNATVSFVLTPVSVRESAPSVAHTSGNARAASKSK